MFFILSKLFWAVARPLNFLFLLALASGLLGKLGFRRLARTGFVLSAFAFAAIGFTQLPDLLMNQLETIVPETRLPAEPAGIIVLGGGIGTQSASGGVGYHLGEAADRLVKGLELRRRYPNARFIYSGGSGALLTTELAEAFGAQAAVEALYGDGRGMELESQSRTTWENAERVAEMIGPQSSGQWILVTSAFHMSRAIGCFRTVGIDVVPAPTDFRAEALQFPWLMDESPIQFLKASLLVKEWIGLVAYYASGRTGALLPR